MEVKTANLALRMNWSLAPLAPRSARRWPGALGFALLALGTGWSAPVAPPPSLPPPSARVVDFARDVRPLLEQRCGKCHGAEKQRGDLRLDQKTAALKGGESGAVILPGRSAESLLILAVAGLDPEKVMPQKG